MRKKTGYLAGRFSILNFNIKNSSFLIASKRKYCKNNVLIIFEGIFEIFNNFS